MGGYGIQGLICSVMRVLGASAVPARKRCCYRAAGTTILLLAPLVGRTEQPAPPPLMPQMILGSSSRGELLFSGRIHFHNRGPACISCHSIGGISFPNGGTLGPDLTNAYTLLGQPGAQAAIHTLYFGVMTPIYDEHPLMPNEQADLLAFLKQNQTAKEPQWITQTLIVVAMILAGIFLLITAVLWRRRLRSVRGALVDRVRRQGVV